MNASRPSSGVHSMRPFSSGDLVSGLVRDLAAVVVVDLVAVVLRGVVRRREDDARGGVQVADGERKRGNRLDARVDVHVDAVCGKDARRDPLEVLALQARVARERDGGVLVVGVQVVGHALRRLRDDVHVHAVRADAERAAEACRAEGEVAIEGVVQRLLVARGDELVKLCLEVWLGDVFLPKLNPGLGFLIHERSPRSSRSGGHGARPIPTHS